MNKQAPPQLSKHRFFIPHLVQDLGRLLENLAMDGCNGVESQRPQWSLKGGPVSTQRNPNPTGGFPAMLGFRPGLYLLPSPNILHRRPRGAGSLWISLNYVFTFQEFSRSVCVLVVAVSGVLLVVYNMRCWTQRRKNTHLPLILPWRVCVPHRWWDPSEPTSCDCKMLPCCSTPASYLGHSPYKLGHVGTLGKT